MVYRFSDSTMLPPAYAAKPAGDSIMVGAASSSSSAVSSGFSSPDLRPTSLSPAPRADGSSSQADAAFRSPWTLRRAISHDPASSIAHPLLPPSVESRQHQPHLDSFQRWCAESNELDPAQHYQFANCLQHLSYYTPRAMLLFVERHLALDSTLVVAFDEAVRWWLNSCLGISTVDARWTEEAMNSPDGPVRWLTSGSPTGYAPYQSLIALHRALVASAMGPSTSLASGVDRKKTPTPSATRSRPTLSGKRTLTDTAALRRKDGRSRAATIGGNAPLMQSDVFGAQYWSPQQQQQQVRAAKRPGLLKAHRSQQNSPLRPPLQIDVEEPFYPHQNAGHCGKSRPLSALLPTTTPSVAMNLSPTWSDVQQPTPTSPMTVVPMDVLPLASVSNGVKSGATCTCFADPPEFSCLQDATAWPSVLGPSKYEPNLMPPSTANAVNLLGLLGPSVSTGGEDSGESSFGSGSSTTLSEISPGFSAWSPVMTSDPISAGTSFTSSMPTVCATATTGASGNRKQHSTTSKISMDRSASSSRATTPGLISPKSAFLSLF